jgi:4-hydroxy-tetrahydrodipicolinate synthase
MEHVEGVKDATANVSRVTLERQKITKPFSFLSGDDPTALGYLAHGGQGWISVTANVAPALCAEMVRRANLGDIFGARSIQDKLMPLHHAILLEPSPGGIKYAMAQVGLCKNELRSPLSPVTPEAAAAIDKALGFAGLV